MSLDAAGCTHTGIFRTNNEDVFRCCREEGVFVVCDGMGGAAAGEIASRMVVDCVTEALCDRATQTAGQSGQSMKDAMLRAIADANRKVYERAQQEPEYQGMGTTIVLARVAAGVAHVAHAGDSRCYLWRRGRLERRTQDHSLVSEQVRLGRMSAEEAEISPYRNIITRALGTQPEVVAEYQQFPAEDGDLLLLCTDGLTRELNDGQIAGELARVEAGEKLAEVCRSLIDAANEAGGRDNITCVLVRI